MSWLNVLKANLRKVGIEMLRYLPDTISTIITFYALFLLMFWGMQIVAAPETADANSQYLIVNWVLWILALGAMQGIGWEITREATRGTLEQLYMSPVGTWYILLARMISTVLIEFSTLILMLALAMLTSGQWLTFDLLTLLPLLALVVACMIGVGFMVAALSLLFKQIQAFLQIAQFIFFALVAVPVGLSPWLELAPVIRGASMIRRAMIEGVTLTQFAASDWLLLAANAAVYLALGVLIYKLAERRAMQRGLLGQY